jgi:hypothetical protein
MGRATRRQWWTRPSRLRESRPAPSSTRRWREMAGNEIAKGRASSDTEALGEAASLARIARRVGSASAPKVTSRAPLE